MCVYAGSLDVVLSFHLSLYTVGELTRPKAVEYRLSPSSNGYIHDVHSPDVRPPVKGKTAKQGAVQRTLLNSETILSVASGAYAEVCRWRSRAADTHTRTRVDVSPDRMGRKQSIHCFVHCSCSCCSFFCLGLSGVPFVASRSRWLLVRMYFGVCTYVHTSRFRSREEHSRKVQNVTTPRLPKT